MYYGKMVCASVSDISLTNDDLLILMLAAQRLILSGRRSTSAQNETDGMAVKVIVGEHYTHFLGLRSRQFEAFIIRGSVLGSVRYFVDEDYLRSASLSTIMSDHARESAQYQGLNVIQPQSPIDN